MHFSTTGARTCSCLKGDLAEEISTPEFFPCLRHRISSRDRTAMLSLTKIYFVGYDRMIIGDFKANTH